MRRHLLRDGRLADQLAAARRFFGPAGEWNISIIALLAERLEVLADQGDNGELDAAAIARRGS